MLPHVYFLEGTSIVIYNLNLFNMAIVIFKYEESILSKNQHDGNACVQPTLVVDWVIRLSGGDTGQATRCREEIDLKLILEMMGSVMIFWAWNRSMFHVIGNNYSF